VPPGGTGLAARDGKRTTVSRIGKKPIEIPTGVTVKLEDGTVHVKGPKGELQRAVPPLVAIEIDAKQVRVNCPEQDRKSRGMHGLARTLINNMIVGVSKGFTRVLEINGVGYKAEKKPGALQLALGYSHPIELLLPKGIEVKIEKNRLELSGIDKEVLGQLAAVVRDQRSPEPYKGKGIKYAEETIRRKVGKAGASG
jgi:large subunit ribosomal protein L6